MELKEILEWRYSTKKFDESKSLTDDQVNKILELTNLSASSYGLQPFKMVVTNNQELKKKLVSSSYGQTNIGDSSHLIVFAARTDLDENFVDNYVGHIAKQRNLSVKSLAAFKNMLMNYINKKDKEALFKMASVQIYIALGTLLVACAAEKIDVCPMGGFNPKEYDEILELKKYNLKSVVLAVMGYRHEDDKYQYATKVRRPLDEMIITI